jgi:hypothetical protein
MSETTAGTDERPARLVAAGALLLGIAVLVDSALEHYRGSFRNPAMALPLIASAVSIALDGERAARGGRGAAHPVARGMTHSAAAAIGVAGLGFHAWNVGKRPGGASFTNFFYGAPIGAPAALTLAAATGAAADALLRSRPAIGPLSIGSGRALGGLAAAGILGTVGEAGLLHFRGAYHNPAMWLPVTLPPLAALALARDVIAGRPRVVTAGLLGATALLGFAGAGFHAYGVSRNMGGWRNWRQNVLAGPPIPAPPAFTGLAVAALGALLRMRTARPDG